MAAATGVPTAGKAWPVGSTLKVASQLPARYDASIEAAIAAYNRSGARISLRRVAAKRGANVVLRLARIPTSALSTQGRPPRGPSSIRINRAWDAAARGDGPYFAAFLIAHELGHVLGMDHPRANRRLCSVMNPGFFDVCRRPPQPAETWACAVLRPIDLATLARLYGGKPGKVGPWYCALPGPPPLGREVEGARVEVVAGTYEMAARIYWTPVPGLRMLVERRDASCAQAKVKMRVRAMEDAAADDTLDAARGVAVDPFGMESPMTVCYWLTLIDPKTEARSATVKLEAQLESAEVASENPQPTG